MMRAALLKKALVKARRTAYQSTASVWLARTISDPGKAVAPRSPVTLDYLLNDKTSLIEWLRTKHAEFSWMFFPQEALAAHRNGHIYVVIRQGKEIIGYLKVGIQDVYIHDFNRIIRFPPEAAFVYDTFVLPGFRGQQVALHALTKTIQFLKNRGYTRLWCHIEQWNSASLGLFRKAGFTEKGTIRFSTFFTVPLFIRDGYNPFFQWEAFLSS